MSEDLWDGCDIISRYTRAQAIEDGGLVDLLADPAHASLVREAGIRVPIAITATAYAKAVQGAGEPLPESQSVKGRLWDILQAFRFVVKQTRGETDDVRFAVSVFDGRVRRQVNLRAVIGPGDEGEPVLTIMLKGED